MADTAPGVKEDPLEDRLLRKAKLPVELGDGLVPDGALALLHVRNRVRLCLDVARNRINHEPGVVVKRRFLELELVDAAEPKPVQELCDHGDDGRLGGVEVEPLRIARHEGKDGRHDLVLLADEPCARGRGAVVDLVGDAHHHLGGLGALDVALAAEEVVLQRLRLVRVLVILENLSDHLLELPKEEHDVRVVDDRRLPLVHNVLKQIADNSDLLVQRERVVVGAARPFVVAVEVLEERLHERVNVVDAVQHARNHAHLAEDRVLWRRLGDETQLALEGRVEALLHPHHRLHKLALVASDGDARERAVPIHEVVVDVPAHETEHVAQVRLVLLDDLRGNAADAQRTRVHELVGQRGKREGEGGRHPAVALDNVRVVPENREVADDLGIEKGVRRKRDDGARLQAVQLAVVLNAPLEVLRTAHALLELHHQLGDLHGVGIAEGRHLLLVLGNIHLDQAAVWGAPHGVRLVDHFPRDLPVAAGDPMYSALI
eukprot:Opistho-1_new@80409